MEWLFEPEAWIALVTLTALEIVLGVDNIIFISILTSKLPLEQRGKGRVIGLALAMGMRIALLFSLAWIIKLTAPLFSVFGQDVSGRDLVLLVGGLFLLAKATHEIHQKLEGVEGEKSDIAPVSFGSILIQITLLDIVFSLDSVITAVGMARRLSVMVIAVVIAVGFMMVFAKALADFVEDHPTVKMLALSFLLLVGTALVADGLHFHFPKGYIYFAMGFSVFVEMLNLRLNKARGKPVNLRDPYVEEETTE
jgi:predicted tellurium resistance membrane protein TerC